MTTREEVILMSKIAARAVSLAREHGISYEHIDAMMDLEHAHAEHPMDLPALLAADVGNFGHDVFGIRRHMDRSTGKLGGCFLPRYTARA